MAEGRFWHPHQLVYRRHHKARRARSISPWGDAEHRRANILQRKRVTTNHQPVMAIAFGHRSLSADPKWAYEQAPSCCRYDRRKQSCKATSTLWTATPDRSYFEKRRRTVLNAMASAW